MDATPTTRPCTTSEDTEEPKKRRRFSSPFRRSRSRPRSVSAAALSSTTSLVSKPSLTAIANDVPEVPKAFQDRPHSYHAPDLGMHPAYRGSTDQLDPASSLHEHARVGAQQSPTRSSFVTEIEIRDDSVPPVPPIPAGVSGEKRGRRSRSWGNASLMRQPPERKKTSTEKSSRSLGASPVVPQFDIRDNTRRTAPAADAIDAPSQVPWNGNEPGRNNSSPAMHSSPVAKGLWMSEPSLKLSERSLTATAEPEDDRTRQKVLPKETDGTLAPADLVHNDAGPNAETPTTPAQPRERSKAFWPSKIDTTGYLGEREQFVPASGEAPVPPEFFMQLSDDISPLLHSSRASIEVVSDDEDGESSPILIDSTTDVADTSSEHPARLPEISSRQTNYETETVGVGDVSPASDYADASVERASTQAYDMQSALESKVVGAGDVSPVSIRSSILVASLPKQPQHELRNGQVATYAANSQAERLHSVDAPSDPESLCSEPSQPNNDQVVVERPRIERFKTAQEEQGPIASELTTRSIRQPASRYAAVLASEPVVSYKEYTGSSSNSSDNVLEVIERQASSGALTPQRAELAPERADGGPMATRRVRSALQVVHAVEEYAASNSSFASTDQGSISVDASTEPDAAVQMRDESDLVTPVAQPPRNTDHHEQQADQAGNQNDTVHHAPSNGYFNDQLPAMAVHRTREDTSAAPNMTAPERSKSLLSIISSAVSSVPISPASSNAGRSTPSTIHRMQRDFSNAKRSNLTDTKIVEEPTSAKDEQTPTARNEDYDLYADHNGLVKDVRDDNGQPLRVASPAAAATAAPAELARTVTTASSIGTAPDIHDSPSRRYSFERPMSFVSGSHDDDGRPQDQINQPGSRATSTPHQNNRSQQYPRVASGAVYSTFEPVQDTHWPPGEVATQPPAQSIQQSVHEPVHAKVVRQPTRFVPQTHGDEEDDSDTPQAAKTQSHRKPTSSFTAQPVAHGMPSPNGRPDANNIQDGRTSHTQHRSVSAPLQQLTLPSQETRVVSQPLSMPPSEPPAAPRNEYEYQQQMMQLQAKYPRFRGSESQALVQQPNTPQQGSHSPEKPSTKPRLAAAIKGIVGRASPHVPVTNNAPPAPSNLAPTAQSHDAARAESFVSAVSSSHEPSRSAPGGQSSLATAPQRPPSRGADSQYSHVSYGSTQVQPAQSRQNLLVPVAPAGYQNMHPHQESVQQSYLAPPPQQQQQNGQTQNFRASTGTMADVGKKKRFSAITGLFSKSNPAAELQGKFKLSREEKKAQKAQKHASQPILQSPPTQQWPPPNTHFISPQQTNNTQNQRFPQAPQFAHPVNSAGTGFASSEGAPQAHPHGMLSAQLPPGPAQVQQRRHQDQQPQQQRPQDEGSAYLRTRQMAEEHRARQAADQPPRPVYEDPASMASSQRQSNEQFHQETLQSQQQRPLPPSNGYYFPDKHPQDQGAYVSSREEHQRVLQMKQQQQLEAERRRNADLPRSPGEQARQQHQRVPSAEHGAYGASQIARQQALHRQQGHGPEQGAYGATQEERQRLQQAGHVPLPGPEAFGRSQIHYDQIQHHEPPQRTAVPPLHERQQPMSNQHQSAMTREEYTRHAQEELARHRWQQQQMQLHQFHLQQQAQLAQQQAANRSVSGPLLSQASPTASPVAQRHVSSPEPQYETPPIPEAYGHVQGVFVSPFDQSHRHTTAHGQGSRREPHRSESDVSMQPISPQVSEQSQMPPNMRHNSDASSVSVISPVSGPNSEPPAAGAAVDQRPQKPRMPSISEVHQQAPPVQDLPWHMNFPAGTTEQDIVRARQKQFLQQQFASQQQAQAERHASSPSPRASPDKQSPPFSAPLKQPQEQGGGFREVLPRQSPQPYPAPQSAPLDRRSPHQIPTHPHGATGRLTNSPTGQESSTHSPAGSQLLMQEPHTPGHMEEANQHPPYAQEQQHAAWNDRSNHESRRVPPPAQQDLYDENVPDEAPPSYDGPGIPHDGMEKSNPERPRPPNIITTPTDHGQTQDGRPRQASVGLMQHPQPASMAASPQRTAPDMGAESLRRQMLQQEEHARMERIQRSQMQALQRQREQQEREIARARAQELERSVSGGGQVGSLRSVSGSRNGGTPGWERRGPQSGSRPIFELPALEDDEPVMRATSFPGQEWVPPMYGED